MKRAQLFVKQKCPTCEEAKAFLIEHGVLVTERDIIKKPLNRNELRSIVGYHDPRYYLDSASASFKKNKLDAKTPSREEVINLITDNPDLLKHPIIVSGRLMTIGSNRQQMIDMFQLTVSDNGSGNGDKQRGASRR